MPRAFRAPWVPRVSAENAWVPLEHSRGKYQRERRASGSGRKRQREGDSAAHTEVGAGGAEGEEEEAGGGGGRSGALAGSCCSRSGGLLVAGDPPGANKAAGAPPGGPSRRGAHVTRGRGPRPPRPPGRPGRARPAREDDGEWGGVRRMAQAAGPWRGQGATPPRVHRPQCLCLSARLSYQMISAQCGRSFLGGEDSNLGSRALEDVKTLCWNPSPGSLPEAHLRQRKFSCCLQIEADRELSKTGTFLLYGYKILQDHLAYFLPSPWNQPFLQEALAPFIGEWS
ncbi:translation initiation factor IF-2-like [Hyaena hyaena]|uniref:translation initiation factor IF-2-like n=1 Tax=Hyaena hyaena TaxID=95912 RepID=UPI001924CE68|nr:translation initiation factor IF-2-like [Hyaena hyaena]